MLPITPYYVELPCKPVVKQYMVNCYGANIIFPEGDWVKLLIESYLQRNIAEQDSKITFDRYTEVVRIPITWKVFDLHGGSLTRTACRAINNRIEQKIHDRLYDFLEFFIYVAHFEQKDAIIMFQQIYNFPDEVYSFDAIKKHFQREIQPYVEKTLIKFNSVSVPLKNPYRFRKAV